MPSPRDLFRLTTEILIGVAAFALAAVAIGRFADVPDVGDFSAKLDWLEAHADLVDVVFVGSSRIQRGIVPAAFDAAAASRGAGIRSFNLGIAGMEPAEADAVVRRLAHRFAERDDRPRWFIVEVATWDVDLEVENRFKGRAIFWHDLEATQTMLRALDAEAEATADGDMPESRARRFDLGSTHLLHWATRASGAGRGWDLIARLTGRRQPPAADAFPAAGYDRYGDASYSTHPMRRTFLDHVDAYRQWLEPRLAVAPGVAVDSETATAPWVADAWARQVRRLEAAGIEPIYLLPPTPRPAIGGRRLAADGILPTLLAFDDPAVHPELFAVDHRFDLEHLTHDGAVELSRRLGIAFADHLADSAADPPLTAERVTPSADSSAASES